MRVHKIGNKSEKDLFKDKIAMLGISWETKQKVMYKTNKIRFDYVNDIKYLYFLSS